jgi:hypothetical protein
LARSSRRPSAFSICAKYFSSSGATKVIASPVAFGASGAADAVHVVFGDHRDVVVDDVSERCDVDAARGDVGRHQHAGFAALEIGERARALRLRAIAVDAFDRHVVFFELRRETVGSAFVRVNAIAL